MSSTAKQSMEKQEAKEFFEWKQKCLMSVMLDELKNHDWMEEMKLKCQAYIRNNGTKTTTVEEVVDFLKEDALKSFPKNVSNVCEDYVKEMEEAL